MHFFFPTLRQSILPNTPVMHPHAHTRATACTFVPATDKCNGSFSHCHTSVPHGEPPDPFQPHLHRCCQQAEVDQNTPEQNLLVFSALECQSPSPGEGVGVGAFKRTGFVGPGYSSAPIPASSTRPGFSHSRFPLRRRPYISARLTGAATSGCAESSLLAACTGLRPPVAQVYAGHPPLWSILFCF